MLINAQELVGFFSYSREDDKGSRGGLSALRDAIQAELSAQLGRTKTDFRVWQDKAAISLGTLWEKQIAQGINQSVFFIPIITPRALRSKHCAFEFQAFLAREAELGRDDLVFPILYIPVPELEDEKIWRNDPVLKVVGTRQYLDWRELRHHDPNSIEVRQRLEWFCRGITNAMHKPSISPEEFRRREESGAAQKTNEKQPPPGAGAAGRAESDDPAAGTEKIASRQAENERAPVAARSNSWSGMAIAVPAAFAVIAVAGGVAWLTLQRNDRTEQVAVFASPPPASVASPDPVPAAVVAEPKPKDADTAPATTIVSPPESAPPPGPSPDEVAWTFVQDTNDPEALRRFIAQFPDSRWRNDADARLAAVSAARAAWKLVKDSNDPEQFRRFIDEFPDSGERPAAEQKIAILAARSPPSQTVVPPPDQHELTRSLQLELQRVGCFKGSVNGQFDDDTKVAWHRFIKLTSLSMSDDVSSDAVKALRGFIKRVCPLDCPRGDHAEGETCVANAPPPARPAKSHKPTPPPDRAPQPVQGPPPSPSIPLSIGIGGGHGGFSIGIH